MSWKVEVQTDSSGTWSGNALRFATHEEAEAYGAHLMARWTLVQESREVESTDAANYHHVDGHLEAIDPSAKETR